MKKKHVILLVIVAAIFIAFTFPTPHARTRQESYTEYETVTKTDQVYSLLCSRTLKDGYSLSMGWTDMQDETKIVVDIQSTEEVRVKLKDITSTFYDSTRKIHDVTFLRSKVSYDISVENPSLFGTGPSAVMTGSIKAYHIYEAQELITKYRTVPYTKWLPWWMP